MREPDHSIDVGVSFGDCDPAGIVFYPNFFRWFDRAFHDFLASRADGHAAVCKRLGSAGIGLMDAGARFRSPVHENERLSVELRLEKWSGRSFWLGYTVRQGERLVADGYEIRGVFVERNGRLHAGEVGKLKTLLEAEAAPA